MTTESLPELGARILVKIGKQYTHRRVIRRRGQLMIREHGGFTQLSSFKPSPLVPGAWCEKEWEEL